jgi:hypothetical protein
MRRAWGILAALVVAGVLALAVAARVPRPAAAPEAPAPPPPLDAASVELSGGQVIPARTAGVLGHRLAITVRNRGGAPVRLSLSGYEHAFAPRVLAPGESRTDTLLLDLPGEDFAWMLDGLPAGQLLVAGSHLAEGHR